MKPKYRDWHLWFAWFLVKVGSQGRWVWLSYAKRKLCASEGREYWDHRFIWY